MGSYLSCIITHGSLACSLKEVSENLGVPSAELTCFSNQEADLDNIETSIHNLITENNPKNIILFVDLMGGSCWVSANRIKHNHLNVTIISGVNVPMIVSFFVNVERLPWNELMNKIELDAKRGVVIK